MDILNFDGKKEEAPKPETAYVSESPKQFNYKLWLFIAGLVIIALLLLNINQCSEAHTAENRIERNTEILKDAVLKKEKIIGTLTSTMQAMEVTQKELENQTWVRDQQLEKLLSKFDKVVSSTIIKGAVVIDSFPVVVHDTIYDTNNFAFTDTIQEPGQYKFVQKYAMSENRFTSEIESMEIPLKLYVNTGYEPKGLFSKDELVTQVTSDNKYVDIDIVSSQVVQADTPIYKKWWLWLIGGVITGVAATTAF